jgi:D-alanyl-D-alanine carboxypeptidase
MIQPLDDIVESVRTKYNLPALGAAVVTAAMGVEALASSGIRMAGHPQRVTDDDRWHLGSNTKAMTATLVGILVDRNTIDWNTAIADAFPEWSTSLHSHFQSVTVDQLLTHRSGIPAPSPAHDMPGDMRATLHDSSKTSVQERRKEYTRLILTRPPRTHPGAFMYSNANFIAIAAMLEKLTNRSWEDSIKHDLFDPLGMLMTGFGAPGGGPDIVDQPLGHRDTTDSQNGMTVRQSVYRDNPVVLGPAGMVHATMRDWAKFLRLHLNRSEGELTLSQDVFDHMHTPLAGQAYVCGWISGPAHWAQGPILAHDGSNSLWYARAIVAPANGFAILMVTNVGTPAPESAMDELQRMLIDRRTK